MIKDIIYILFFILIIHFILYYLKVNIYDVFPIKNNVGIECEDEILKLKDSLNEFKNINVL
jgi:hypothetical protein